MKKHDGPEQCNAASPGSLLQRMAHPAAPNTSSAKNKMLATVDLAEVIWVFSVAELRPTMPIAAVAGRVQSLLLSL